MQLQPGEGGHGRAGAQDSPTRPLLQRMCPWRGMLPASSPSLSPCCHLTRNSSWMPNCSSECNSQCIHKGRYCSPDPDGNLTAGYSGSDVVQVPHRCVLPWGASGVCCVTAARPCACGGWAFGGMCTDCVLVGLLLMRAPQPAARTRPGSSGCNLAATRPLPTCRRTCASCASSKWPTMRAAPTSGAPRGARLPAAWQ